MKKLILSTIIALSVSTGGIAFAQQSGNNNAKKSDKKVEYKKKTVYDFEADTVEGTLIKPEGDFIGSRVKSKHSSLIKIRQDFVPEILKSVNDI